MSSSAPPNDPKQDRQQKHRKRMNKILFKAWNLPDSAPFQHCQQSNDGVADLTTVGRNLDEGAYEKGRSGWESFAKDMGRVYNGYLIRKGKHSATAKSHLEKVVELFSKIDSVLGDVVSNSKPLATTANDSDKKRKGSVDNGESSSAHVSPRKKLNAAGGVNGSLTLSQREKMGMEVLAAHLEERGGERSQADIFRCKVVQRPGGRYDTIYFSAENKRFKSIADICRFLNLEVRPTNGGGGKIRKRGGSKVLHHRTTSAPKESERKKLRRDLDRLVKSRAKAAKSLEDHKNDIIPGHNMMSQESLRDDGSNAAKAHREGRVVPPPDIDTFPGIPTHCIPDMLMVWDFLCTFCRTLSLEPIDLDNFAAALSFRSPERDAAVDVSDEMTPSSSSIPVYLSEAHIALLRLLIQDPTSDTWWWSVLETPEMVEEEGDEYLNAVDRKRKMTVAVVKIDMEGLLNVDEDPGVTIKWLQALEDIRIKKPDNSGPIKSAIKTALAITTNHLVKAYLKKAMRTWRERSAGLVKRAVVWLIDKVREARPDLWGRVVSKEELSEQKQVVVAEAALEMDRIVEDADSDIVGDLNLEEDSDEDSVSDEDEGGSDNEDEYADQGEAPVSPTKQACSTTLNDNDDITPVSTFVPTKPVPSVVDLLLPPGKPVLSSDLVHALTWPPLIGATSLRVLHWYKRRRNEVDDSIREFRQLRPISVSERRRRETTASLRILSECGDQSDVRGNDVESAIKHLCDGKDYLSLTTVQRLCILRVLIEAMYDTHHVQQNIEDNFKARMNAVKSLEAEERRAKKESREELATIEAAARERLARDARETFIEKKRQEIFDCIHETDLTEEDVENLEDDELIEFDDETKLEYDALPTPESFNKAEINSMVTKIQEETAFGAEVLTVLSLKDIEKKDEQHLKSLEDELDSYGDVASLNRNTSANREISAKVDRIRKDIIVHTEKSQSVAEDRSTAIEALKDAIEDGTVKTLKTAIKTAKLARLSGDDDETGGVWALDLLRDAALELKIAESRKRVTEAQKDLIAKRNKCFIRTDALGRDRYNSSFVHFDYDKNSRIWAERDIVLLLNESESQTENAVLLSSTKAASIGARDQEEDFLAEDDIGQPYEASFLSFARKEYHPSAKLSTLSKHHWSCYTTDRSLRILVKNLTGKCAQEKTLKDALKGTLETMALTTVGEKVGTNHLVHNEEPSSEHKEGTEFRTSGDDDMFNQAKQERAGEDIHLVQHILSAVGARIRLRRIPDPYRAPDVAEYIMGTVTGWKSNVTACNPDVQPSAIWRLGLDDGGELCATAMDTLEGIIRAFKWSNQSPGYVEHDAPFLSYRNGIGRFCGRAAEAPLSLTALAFAKQLLKKEQDLYTPLKNRTFENNWGGKNGARNAWVSSLKEYGHTFEAVRDGLLTLEQAFFELAGGCGGNKSNHGNSTGRSSNGESDGEFQLVDIPPATNNVSAIDGKSINGETTHCNNPPKLSGKDLLYDESSRFDIELESLSRDIKGLWNSFDTRDIFREIVSECKTVSILALGLDLMCRNCQAYINRTKSSVVPLAIEGERSSISYSGRRRAAMQAPGAYSDFFK